MTIPSGGAGSVRVVRMDTDVEPVLALVKGINVGGRRRVPMAPLRAALGAAGLTGVRTHIQSGNVIFDAPSSPDADLSSPDADLSSPDADLSAPDVDPAATVAGVVAATFGFDVEVVARTRSELAATVANNPLARDEDDPAKLHVVFLDAAPAPDRAAQLDPDRSPPDRAVLIGREVYVHYPEGSARSKLTADYLQRTLHRTATARNLRTVETLLELMTAR
jgi:uncharacterized protein (DUF1697 family)